MILRHLAVWLESHHPSEPVVSSLFFFSLINVDPTDVGDRDCRMLKKDYPSYACFFQCQYYNKEASKLILEPTKDPFGFLIFTYCTSDELDLGSVQIASNRHPWVKLPTDMEFHNQSSISVFLADERSDSAGNSLTNTFQKQHLQKDWIWMMIPKIAFKKILLFIHWNIKRKNLG